MDSRMSLQMANERIADWHRSAAAAYVAEPAAEPKATPVIALRRADADEADDLRELAALDSKRPLTGEAIVALVDGRLVAAISLDDLRIVADPLVPTADVRVLLRQRATQLTVPARTHRRRFLPRFA
jgi:hypothetical protein